MDDGIFPRYDTTTHARGNVRPRKRRLRLIAIPRRAEVVTLLDRSEAVGIIAFSEFRAPAMRSAGLRLRDRFHPETRCL
jgi:hypothetical protein